MTPIIDTTSAARIVALGRKVDIIGRRTTPSPVRPPLRGGLAVLRGPETLQPVQNDQQAYLRGMASAMKKLWHAGVTNPPVIPPSIEVHQVVVDTDCQSGGHRRDLRIILRPAYNGKWGKLRYSHHQDLGGVSRHREGLR